MKRSLRLLIAVGMLLFGLGVHFAMWRYCEAAGPIATVGLTAPLASLPMQLGDWVGKERPPDEDQELYGDEYIQRDYVHQKSGEQIALWVTYSSTGVDRGHHPEVCMVVHGKTEETQARTICPVDGPGDPVQQYRFAGPLGDRQWVFYWHYTLAPGEEPQISQVQRLYRLLRRRPSSVTMEVFAPEHTNQSRSEESAAAAREFVKLVDSALQRHVGPTAVRGNRRLPITVVEPDRVPKLNESP